MAYFKSCEKKVYYESFGEGTPLILLNGIMMSTESWNIFKTLFSKKYKLILFDFIDQGRSDKVSENYTQALQVEVLEDLRKHLDIESFHLLGISYGGEVALQYAKKYEKHLKSLMLANTTAYTDPQLRQVGDSWIDAAKTHDGRVFFNASIPPVYSKAFFEQHENWLKGRQTFFEKAFDAPWYDAFVRLVKSAETYDVRDEIAHINTETLIISADDDGVTPRKCQEYIYKTLKNTSWVTLNNCGHASMYEQPIGFSAAILGFLESYTHKFS